MKLNIKKYPEIVVPDECPWRRVSVFNPGAIYHDGKTYLFERASGWLSPHVCMIGLQESTDGINFRQTSPKPVLTGADVGYPYGSVEDPRVVYLEGRFYMTYALRRFCGDASGGGQERILEFYRAAGCDPDPNKNFTVSGIAVSDDLLHWKNLGLCSPLDVDDRDVILFPEKIKGKYVLLRRPCATPWLSGGKMFISYSDTLKNGGNWTAPIEFAAPIESSYWENSKIGGCTPPVRTPDGFLVIYHGVDYHGEYRVGAMLLDLEYPEKIIARTHMPIMVPDQPSEINGIICHHVIFPCGITILNGNVFLYYGEADSTIGVAILKLADLLEFIKEFKQDQNLEANIKKIAACMKQSNSSDI